MPFSMQLFKMERDRLRKLLHWQLGAPCIYIRFSPEMCVEGPFYSDTGERLMFECELCRSMLQDVEAAIATYSPECDNLKEVVCDSGVDEYWEDVAVPI